MHSTQTNFATNLKENDTLEVGGSREEKESKNQLNLTGHQVSTLTEKTREKAVERVISGKYLLLYADFTDSDDLKVTLRSIEDGYEFKAKIPLGVIGDEQSEIIKEDSWNKKAMELDILVKQLHSRYTSAKVIAVKS